MTTPHGLRKISRSQVAKCFEVFRQIGRQSGPLVAIFGLLLASPSVYAQDAWSYSTIEESAHEFHRTTSSLNEVSREAAVSPPTAAFFTPLDWLDAWIETGLRATQGLFDLLQYMQQNTSPRSREDLLSALPKYDRVELFGGWINEDSPADCYNTRAEVLLRDADPNESVQFTSRNKCMVYKAKWIDPFSGAQFKLANAIQVDHIVPLKAAYLSGAHAWNQNRRCRYANFMDDPTHLLSVSGHENMSKGDAGPERYLPPDTRFTCKYLHIWMKVKAVWGLEYPAEEAAAIQQALAANKCPASATSMPVQDHQNLRAESLRPIAKCGEVEP